MFEPVKSLFGSLLVYGIGDVATSLVSLLLLPVFTRYLTPSDYGVITMLLTIEAVTKVTFRWGVDTAFMRLYYDCANQAARQRLASTLFFFLLAVNGTLAIGAVASSGWLTAHLIDASQSSMLVALTIVNTFVAGFYFIPYQVLRIEGRPRQYIAFTFGRSAGTIVARLAFVIWGHLGVLGIVMADLVVTSLLTLVLTWWFVPLIRPVFSREVLNDALRFGLPRVPHSFAQQVIGVADRYFLKAFTTLGDVGLYSIGASFGLTLKLFLSAFESAWTPFFLGLMREPDASRVYSMVSTYVVAVLVLLVTGLCAVAPGVVRLTTTSAFHGAAAVTPWIALGVMFQGLYLVGSIGLVITKRTKVYPLTTGIAAAASLAANALLIPRFGVLGAAWANVVAYATLAIVTTMFSWRAYPIHYEWARLTRIFVAGATSYAIASLLPGVRWLIGDIVLRGGTTVIVYVGVLALAGFFHAGEARFVQETWRRLQRPKASRLPAPTSGDVEMAGEIISSGSDPAEAAFEDSPAGQKATPGSPDSHR